MTANIKVLTAATNGVLVLPAEAVHTETNQTVVWRANPADRDKPLSVPIVTGLSNGKKVEICSGLQEDDPVLVKATFKMATKEDNQKNPFMPFGGQRRR